ncbi:unnamed protein product [Linum tenue]|uniref:Uncharacterized protein n=1 Tax=Linum tenue TaxID=586396 RepID=A0AAV0S2P3_9ROSI|nr:unnamed protein product [Linum tenue]
MHLLLPYLSLPSYSKSTTLPPLPCSTMRETPLDHTSNKRRQWCHNLDEVMIINDAKKEANTISPSLSPQLLIVLYEKVYSRKKVSNILFLQQQEMKVYICGRKSCFSLFSLLTNDWFSRA